MANAKLTDGRDDLLIEMLQTLKTQEGALLQLTSDVEGLKALLTDEQRPAFERAKEKTLHESAFGFDRQVRLLDAAIERLRGT